MFNCSPLSHNRWFSNVVSIPYSTNVDPGVLFHLRHPHRRWSAPGSEDFLQLANIPPGLCKGEAAFWGVGIAVLQLIHQIQNIFLGWAGRRAGHCKGASGGWGPCAHSQGRSLDLQMFGLLFCHDWIFWKGTLNILSSHDILVQLIWSHSENWYSVDISNFASGGPVIQTLGFRGGAKKYKGRTPPCPTLWRARCLGWVYPTKRLQWLLTSIMSSQR